MSLAEMKDEEIIVKLIGLAGKRPEYSEVEQQYFNEIFNRYSHQAYSLSRYYGLRKNDADDVVQESFIRLYDNILYFDVKRLFKPYFFKIVHNLTKNKFRELKRHSSLSLDEIRETDQNQGESFDEKMGNNEQLRCIINKLPEKMREVLIMKVYGSLEPFEIAETLGISIKSVYYRLDIAAKIVKEQWKDDL